MPLSDDQIVVWLSQQVDGIKHSRATLFDHLFGVFMILREKYQRPLIVQHAGLCHTLYETTYFKNPNLRSRNITRKDLAGMIGPEAEYLVYLFCNMPERTPSLIENRYNLPKDLLRELLYIELADAEEMDQRDPMIERTERIRRALHENL